MRYNANLKRRLFYTYFSLFFVPLLAIGTLFAILTVSNAREDARNECREVVESMAQEISGEFGQLDRFAHRLSETRFLQKLMYTQGDPLRINRIDPISIRDFNQQFSVYSVSNRFVAAAALYLNEKNLIFTGEIQIADMDLYIETYFDMTQAEKFYFAGIPERSKFGQLVWPVTVRSPIPHKAGMLYVVSLPTKSLESIKGTLIFIINPPYLKGLVTDPFPRYNGRLTLQLPDDRVVVEHTRTVSETETVPGNFADKVLSTTGIGLNQGRVTTRRSRRRVVIDVPVSHDLWLSYQVSAGGLYLEATKLLILWILAFIPAIGAGTFAAYLLSNRNYRPVERIYKLVQAKWGEMAIPEKRINEYDYIFDHLSDMPERKHLVVLEQQKPQLIRSYLRALVEHNYSDLKELERRFTVLEVEFPYQVFACIVVHKSDPDELPAVECLPQVIPHVAFRIPYNRYACLIVNTVGDDEVIALAKGLTAGIRREIQQESYCGVGGIYNRMEDLHLSYTQAVFAIEYHMLESEKDVHVYRYIKEGMDYFYFPIDREIDIATALRTGDSERSLKIVDSLLETNTGIQNISPKAIRNLFFSAYMIGLRIMSESECHNLEESDPAELMSSETINDMREIVALFYHRVCSNCRNGRAGHTAIMVHRIEQFVSEHYADKNLSLTTLADHLGMSTSHVSRFFNSHFNRSFPDYLNHFRITKAIELMTAERGLMMKDLSERVGYYNPVTFRRSFKRVTGSTPTEYRLVHE